MKNKNIKAEDIIKYLDLEKIERKSTPIKKSKKDSGIAPQKKRDKPE